MRKGNLVFALVLALAAIACSSSLGGGGDRCAQSDQVPFQDDFSDTGSGWGKASLNTGDAGYQDGGYHLTVNADYQSLWANPGCDFTDVSVEVDAHKIGGVDDNEFGVICRYQDIENFYAASISSDGFYGLIRIVNNEFGYLGMDAMQGSDVINLGSASNHIRLDCVGNTLTLYVNGEMVATATDSSYAHGDVGLYAGTFATPGIDILFDNFKVSKP